MVAGMRPSRPPMNLVLIVEDDPHLRRVFRALLEGEGFEVTEASDGMEGLQAVAARRPDCIIADAMMPRLDGITMLTRIAALGHPPPSLVVSALHQLPSHEDLRRLGVAGVFGKPFAFDQLVEAVKAIVAGEP